MKSRCEIASRARRRLLKAISASLLPLATPGLFAAEEFVVVDGWVMKRSDLERGRDIDKTTQACTPI